MATLYPWFVLAHVGGTLLFVGAHGVSMWMSFRLRGEHDRAAVTSLLTTSAAATRVAYLGLLLLGIGGIGAATIAGLWTTPWVLGSVVIFVAAFVVMYAVGAPYYYGLRDAIAGNEKKGVTPATDEELAARLVSRRPEILAASGGTALVLLVALMVLKPY
jgi:hypothetical protein